MNVEVFTLCDAATNSQGKLNLLGAFDTLYAQMIPTLHPQCAVACRIRFKRIEQGDHRIMINLVDDDGKMVIDPLETGLRLTFNSQEDASVTANLVLNLHGVKLDKYGEYSVDLAIDGRQEASLPLFVKPAPRQSSAQMSDTSN